MKLVRREQPLLDYASSLKREISLLTASLPARMSVDAVHWGGGTPLSLKDDSLLDLMQCLQDRFHISDTTETSFEIDPRTFSPDRADTLKSLGATRVSLGVQEFDAGVQTAVNRIQPFEQVRDVVDALRSAGIGGINFDLMYGLPRQSKASLLRTIDLTLTLKPDRIALFGYAHVPWMAKRQTRIDDKELPGPEARFDQAEAAAEALVDAGYVRIGLDHFALPDDSMAHAYLRGTLQRTFQGYSAGDPRTILGLGSSSISTLPQGFVQNVAETGAWARDVIGGCLPIQRGYALTSEDRLRSDVIEALMCDLSVDLVRIANRHGCAPDRFDAELAACEVFAKAGLVDIENRRLHVRDAARPALRVIAAVFDAHAQSSELRHAIAV